LFISDPGSGALMTPGSGMGKNQDPDPGLKMNIPDHISESLEKLDPGWVKNQDPDPGLKMNILDHISESLENNFLG
jgi:hypothetical protein